MLRLKSVHTYYGNIHALKGVSLHVNQGEIVTLIGANGAGKTTALKTVSGLIHANRGTIAFEGRDITRLSAERIVRHGISHVPEGRKVFATMTLKDNLEMGAFIRRDREEARADMEKFRQKFPILAQRWHQMAGTLSGGEQQMLAITRALMARPKLLILDEPSMGLSPLLVKETFKIIKSLREEGTTILLIEQNARAALHIADRGYVLETGKIVLQGKCQMLLEHNEVKRAYLGERLSGSVGGVTLQRAEEQRQFRYRMWDMRYDNAKGVFNVHPEPCVAHRISIVEFRFRFGLAE